MSGHVLDDLMGIHVQPLTWLWSWESELSMDALCDPTGREGLAGLLCVSEVATEWLSAFYLALWREKFVPIPVLCTYGHLNNMCSNNYRLILWMTTGGILLKNLWITNFTWRIKWYTSLTTLLFHISPCIIIVLLSFSCKFGTNLWICNDLLNAIYENY